MLSPFGNKKKALRYNIITGNLKPGDFIPAYCYNTYPLHQITTGKQKGGRERDRSDTLSTVKISNGSHPLDFF
jgi:hypothetical protein